jgi:RNA polymerase sigma factor (TIGR02999 family)
VSDPGEVTRLLGAWREGDSGAFNRLLPLVYDDLRAMARSHARRLRPGHTLDTTGLVHEAYLRLAGHHGALPEDRQHFLSVCARAMRQIAIDGARRRSAAKRGGGGPSVTFDEQIVPAPGRPEWLLDLDAALERLGAHSERLVRVVECRYFAGLSEEETSEAMGLSLRTVQREWMKARAWLREELGDPPTDGGGSLG